MKYINNSANFWFKTFPFKTKKSHKYSRGQLIVVEGEKEMVWNKPIIQEISVGLEINSYACAEK